MSEFERCKEQVGGRSVVITSWYDENTKTWRASAPSYSHLCSSEIDPKACPSRKAAITRIVGLLAANFSSGRC